jgi:hypothetical protein
MRRPSSDLSDPSRNLAESHGPPTTTIDAEAISSLPMADEIEAEQPMLDIDDSGPSDTDRIAVPPHIAARFYRPTQTRRKGSAASSRRNSISSVHSRSSHGVGVLDGPQSKYVAQHLRRASILEDRKARLADRAAHAEKVRLRAATAKAASRHGASTSEERAAAAAQARERNLASIAASCAEEVKRAKAVAEHMKEKREMELQRMRTQMEERLAEAERRREELQRRNSPATKARARGQSQSLRERDKTLEVLPEVSEGDSAKEVPRVTRRQLSPEEAADRIRWWWRAAQRKRAVSAFSNLGLTIDTVRGVPFEKVTELLGEERVLVATSRILRICGLQEGAPGTVEEMAAVRTFLSAYLILGHPSQVLSNKDGNSRGEQEQVGAVLPKPKAAVKPIPRDDLANPQLQDLVAKARDLLITFETVLSRLTTTNSFTPPPTLKDTLPETYATFYNAFIAWKARDSTALTELMIMQFVELDAIWQTVKDSTDGSVDQVYKESIKKNQLELIVRIKRLAGAEAGKKMIFQAVQKARAAAKKAPTGDTRPRTMEEAGDSKTSADDHLHALNAQTLTPPPTPSSSHSRTADPTSHSIPTSAGPIISSLLPENRIVVHELALDKDYRMDARNRVTRGAMLSKQEAMQSLFKGIRYILEHDNGNEPLARESHARLLVRIAETIRENLQRLLKQGSSMYNFVGEILDADMIGRELVAGNFSYDRFFSAMGALLPKLCAPIRDEEVKELVEVKFKNGSYVDRLEALMAFIDVMLVDYGNHLLAMAAPGLIASATPYEAKAFGDGLAAGAWNLDAAETAWRNARQKVLAETARRDPEGINHPKSRPTPDAFYNQMMVDLFTQMGQVDEAALPAMLRLDHGRAVKNGRLTRHIVTAGAILLQCKNMLKRDVRAQWKLEATRILTVLEASDKTNEDDGDFDRESAVEGIMAALESGRSMPAATKAHLKSFVSKIVAASAEVGSSASDGGVGEPVLRLLTSRLRVHILTRLNASGTEKVRAASTAGEKLAGLGLAEFVQRVRELLDELGRIGSVDREAHAVWWEEVAGKVENETQDSASASA